MEHKSPHPYSPGQNHAGPSSSGITLILPSLKMIKQLKSKKGKTLEDAGVKKAPRPIKLKPLKDVLSMLINKVKKKDVYGFFLEPVDPSKVAGYAEAIKRPMDFGTITTKVAKGKYRSLEEFAADFHLVISNAKSFNPPGTIYHAEAERIEAFGAEHIAKAAAHVIEYETDWNIEIERDEEVNMEADDGDGAGAGAGGSIESGTPARRSPSVSSAAVPPVKRSRGAAKKGGPGMLSETLEPDGHLPGFKDGLAAFPPLSDWAELMVVLKLKGKRYRTKKERMRMEKGGPPLAADGSIDYAEMEDPFSILSVLVSESDPRPQLTPLYPPSTPPDPSHLPLPAPIHVLVPDERPPAQQPVPAPVPAPKPGAPKYRYWTVSRNASARAKPKDKEDEDPPAPPAPAAPREAHTADYGAFATLEGRLARETGAGGAALRSQQELFDALRASIASGTAGARAPASTADQLALNGADYWTAGRAGEAQEYLREVVFGGADGLAYVRSVAEFVAPPDGTVPPRGAGAPLGTSLAHYVERTLIDALTSGRHRVLRAAAAHLAHPHVRAPRAAGAELELARALHAAQHVRPPATHALALLRQLGARPIDLATLIRAPEELYAAEGALAAAVRGEGAGEGASAAAAEAGAGADDDDPVVLERALRRAADMLEGALARGARGARDVQEEDALRLVLLALAKRAPLDQIARMPAELVPAHLRRVVPTIGY